jgi:hypothetical protein
MSAWKIEEGDEILSTAVHATMLYWMPIHNSSRPKPSEPVLVATKTGKWRAGKWLLRCTGLGLVRDAFYSEEGEIEDVTHWAWVDVPGEGS